MMEIIPPNTRFDFLSWRRAAAIASAVMVVVSLFLLFVRGPKLGIDFAGGSLVHARFAGSKQADDIRGALAGAGFADLDIQEYGSGHSEFLIRVPLAGDANEALSERISQALRTAFGADQVDILRVEAVGPRVGEALRGRAVSALLLATLMMGIYIWVRFEWRFGIATGAALLHDVIIVVGFLIAFGYEYDLNIVASLLTVVGFSVNDKVVVSDRIRENRRKDRRSPMGEIINNSVNETLSRTILTNGMAFLAVLSLFVLGGSVIHGFAFALVVGSLVGTYSTIFIASPILLFFEKAATAPVTERRDGRAAAAPAARRR